MKLLVYISLVSCVMRMSINLGAVDGDKVSIVVGAELLSPVPWRFPVERVEEAFISRTRINHVALFKDHISTITEYNANER